MGKTVCFGCRRSLDENDHLHSLTGACDSCFKALLSSRDENLSAYLESLNHPAALVAEDHAVLRANSRFRELRLDQEVVGRRIGEALECTFSTLLGRCGQAEVCILCSLKRSVDYTRLTGEGLRAVPVSYHHGAEGRRTIEVTTERVGNAVLLLLNPIL